MVTKLEFIAALKGIQEQINELNERLYDIMQYNNEIVEEAIIDLASELKCNKEKEEEK